jgi:hypothetical protein
MAISPWINFLNFYNFLKQAEALPSLNGRQNPIIVSPAYRFRPCLCCARESGGKPPHSKSSLAAILWSAWQAETRGAFVAAAFRPAAFAQPYDEKAARLKAAATNSNSRFARC